MVNAKACLTDVTLLALCLDFKGSAHPNYKKEFSLNSNSILFYLSKFGDVGLLDSCFHKQHNGGEISYNCGALRSYN